MSTQANVSTPEPTSIDSIRGQLATDVGGLVAAAKRAYRLRAILLWSAAAFAALLFLVAVDMGLRREELGLRVLFFLTWTGCAVAGAYWWIGPAWKFAPSKVELARWIERSQPELGERLSTAVELAEVSPTDERLGSQQFRDAVLRGWSGYAARVDWRSYVDHSSWLRAGGLLSLALVAAFTVAAWRPVEVRLAVERLFAPWAMLPWPQQDQLQFVDLPNVVANGQELNLEIVDLRSPMPDVIELLLRFPDSDSPQETITFSTKNLTDVAVASIPSVDQPIEIRAVGGDDRSMDWHRVDVAQPPKLETFRLKIQPPEYSGRPASEIVGNRVQVLAGSRVQFVGRFVESVLEVQAAMQPKPNAEGGEASAVNTFQSVDLDANGRDFEWTVCDESTLPGVLAWRWRVTVKKELAIESPELWSVEVIPDAVPIVTLADQEMSQLSPDAAVLIQGKAVDDLGLEEVVLRWQIENSDVAEPGQFLLWSMDDAKSDERRDFAVDRTWQLDSSLELLSGQRLNLWLEARDTRGQVGKSTSQTLEIRDAADVLESIAARQSQLLEQVRAITEAQRRNSQLVARSRQVAQQSDSLRREEIDALVNVVQMQQSVNRQLSGERNSVAESLRTLLKLLDNNQLSEADMAQQVKALSDRIESVSAGQLSKALDDAQQALEQMKEAAASAAKPGQALSDALAASESSQNESLAELQALTDRLAQSEALRGVERELGQVLNQQQSLRRDTDNLELQRLAGMKKEDFQSNRAGLQADQQGLAEAVDQLQKRAKALIKTMPVDQTALKAQVDQAIDRLTKDQVSGQMRAVTESIANDRFVEAAEAQAEIINSLRNALQKLNSASARNLEGQLGQMKSTAAELEGLAAAQAELAQKLAAPDASPVAAALSVEQRRLQRQTEDQQARSAQLGDHQTAQSLSQASESQQLATESAERGQAEEAANQAARAAQELADAAVNSAERAKELEREVAEQQLMQLGAALSQLVSQQQPIVTNLDKMAEVQLDILPDEAKKTAEQEIRQLASRQEAVRQMVRDVRERSDKLPAFGWTLEQVESDMERAIAATQRYRLSPNATESASRALRKLEQAASALQRPERLPENPRDPDAATTESNEEGKSNGRPVPPLASLKLLRGLQADINEETVRLGDAKAATSSDRSQLLEQLSQQQLALGLQLEKILRELAASTDSNQ